MAISEEPNGDRYLFDDVIVDRPNFRVWKGQESRPLPPRAFDLLMYLIEHRDRVVEKQELFENVWEESFVTDNALTRAIKEVRRELGDDAANPRYIATVHKRGYRFIADLIDQPPERPGAAPEMEAGSGVRTGANAVVEPSGVYRNNALRLLAGVAIMVLLIVVGVRYFGRGEKDIRSLAVLPLENSTGDPESEFMSDGITESLINSLSRLPRIKVIPRTTAFRYKRKEVTAREVGRELGVDAVLTGRVVQKADNLIVQTELTNTADGSQFWGERFSRKLSDIFVLQEEIAKVISQKLRLELTGEEEKRLTKRYTEDPRAYELYLRGRYHLAKLSPPDVQASTEYFQRASEADPAYPLAYVGLADAYSALALSMDLPSTDFYPKAKAAAQKALQLDDTVAEAHTALGFALQFYDWDFRAAEAQYKRALELDPNSPDTYFAYATLLTLEGKHAEALARIGRARELDPLNLRINAIEGRFLAIAGKVDEGLGRLQETIELEPNYFLAHLFASNIHAEKGMYREAIAEATTARDLSRGNGEAIAWIGYALAMSGKRAESRAILEELRTRATERYVPPYNFALVYHGLGDSDETFKWLERGFEQRDPKILFLKSGRIWSDLQADPRYISLLERMNLSGR